MEHTCSESNNLKAPKETIKNNDIIKNVIWIDQNIDNINNTLYAKEIESMNLFNFKTFKNIDEAIIYLKNIKFEETKIIVSGRFYGEFVRAFKANIVDMCIAPKLIVFTTNRKRFFEYNKEYEYSDNLFFSYGGIAIIFKEVKEFLINDKKHTLHLDNKMKKNKVNSPIISNISDDIRLSFDYIDCKEKLVLPLLFKSLIDNTSNDNMEIYTNTIYNDYSQKSPDIKKLIGSIQSIPYIPIEILSKYYSRLFTAPSSFHSNMNKDLQLNKIDKYLSFIKTLYEGVKLESLPLASGKILYRGAKILNKEIMKLKYYNKNKIKYLPSSIVFSKSFLSFSKERKVAEFFFNLNNKDKNLSNVLFILEKDDKLDYNLCTHSDIENISFFPSEKEVLFFPFSSFEVKEIKDIIKNEKYEIRLLYLGKYLEDIKNDKNITINGKNIPNCEFKKQLAEFGLIDKSKIKNITLKKLYNFYKKYEDEIKENKEKRINLAKNENKKNENNLNDKKDDKINEDKKNENNLNGKKDDKINENKKNENNLNDKKDDKIIEEEYNNIIIGIIDLGKDDINKEIQIINSYEQAKYNEEFHEEDENESAYDYWDDNYAKNEDLLKKNIKIKIDGNKIDFAYQYKFGNEGLHKIEYLCNKNVTQINHMFYNCLNLKNLDFSNFDSQNVENMREMLYNCKSLTNINLSNFNTSENINMENMFDGCNSLIKENIITEDGNILKTFANKN